MDIVKALVLAGTARLFVSGIAPPKRAAESRGGKAAVYKGQPFEYLVRSLAYIACVLVSASALTHAALLLYRAEVLPTEPLAPLIPWLCPSKPPSLDPLATFSPRFIAGVILVAAGGGMRISTYRALGSLFTYEVFVKDDHRLVTSGPYRYVRHPSYTGMVLLLLGTHLIHFGDGGYATYCDLAATPMVFGVWFWKISAPFALLSVSRRCPVEDAQLRERFGKEWEKYRQETPYAMLPFLY